MMDEWSLEISTATGTRELTLKDDDWLEPWRRSVPTETTIRISILRYGQPVFTADGPLSITLENGGVDALRDFINAANRKAGDNVPAGG